MIENATQLKISKRWLRHFKSELTSTVKGLNKNNIDDNTSKQLTTYKAALESQIESLQKEIEDYKHGKEKQNENANTGSTN